MAPIALQRLHPPCHRGANAKALNFRDYLDSYLPLMGQPAKWWRGVPSVVARRRFFFEKKNQKTFVYYGPTCRRRPRGLLRRASLDGRVIRDWNKPMDITRLSTGKSPPLDINVVVEIPQGSSVKYELDKESGAIVVDRFLFSPMSYPAAYGFIPGTLAEDGDPADALVLVPSAVVPGAVIRCRPIGVLHMEDEAGPDEKIICVPHDKVHPLHGEVESVDDLAPIMRRAFEHFFETYKNLEPGKWVKVHGWGGVEDACAVINKAIAAAGAH
jgi:inorganic pyrophosphatase